MGKTALIIGAGPAGLTAAYELLEKTDIHPVILEQADFIGGISTTRTHHGNKMDMGGHRFFSKSDLIIQWWKKILPVQGAPSADDILFHRHLALSHKNNAPNPEKEDLVMLVRSRVSRIYHLNKFFDYPVKLNLQTFKNLGYTKTLKISFSYLKSLIFKRPGNSLEDFFINRFGTELYQTFFKDYTEKLWGIPCSEIAADWGAQRIKGLSVVKVLLDILKIGKKETSLIETFWYPKLGSGQLWEEVARRIRDKGGEIYLNTRLTHIYMDDKNQVMSVGTDKGETFSCDYLLSSMPIRDLIRALPHVPEDIQKISDGLMYRGFRTCGLLLKKMKLNQAQNENILSEMPRDTWIYIQEKGVKLGRVQIFNNWSPYLVKNFKETVFIGLEYFCNEQDDLWQMSDADFIRFSGQEAARIGLIDTADILDSVSFKVPKAYPAYSGTYPEFAHLRAYLDTLPNLFVMGRNGMHRYNNMDHSMLAAMAVVEEIAHPTGNRDSVWNVNTDREYHEEK